MNEIQRKRQNVLKAIQDSFQNDIQKGGKKTGYYTDTSENRKLGRVGKKYKKDKKITQEIDANKIINKYHFSEEEANDIKEAVKAYNKGNFKGAANIVEGLDTSVRESFPMSVLKNMGFKLTEKGEEDLIKERKRK